MVLLQWWFELFHLLDNLLNICLEVFFVDCWEIPLPETDHCISNEINPRDTLNYISIEINPRDNLNYISNEINPRDTLNYISNEIKASWHSKLHF